jgi:acetoin utilization protein AcuB
MGEFGRETQGTVVAYKATMRASTPMIRRVVVVPPELTLVAAWSVMASDRIRHLPVVRAGALIGMLSDRDVLSRGTMGKDGVFHAPAHTLVGEAMTPTPLVTCDEHTDISVLVRTMTEKKIDAVPVVHGLRLVGLVTSTDLMLLLLEREEARAMPFTFDVVEQRHMLA